MKLHVSPRPRRITFFWTPLAVALIAMLATHVSVAHAAIVGINTPTWSVASINFDDTNSIGPPAGITNTGPTVTPWNGSLVSLPLTTDPNTLDQASGDISATLPGNPLGLTTPALVPNTTLTLDGWFRFRGDPATIQG
jgi:hypothetical protein